LDASPAAAGAGGDAGATDLVSFALVMFLASLGAGAIGALVGLGGGLLITPILTLGFSVHIHYAIGASLVAIIATSTGAAAAYVRDGLTDLRTGVVLELATVSGGLSGALLAARVAPAALQALFGAVLLASLILVLSRMGEELPGPVEPDGLSRWLRLGGSYTDEVLGREVQYRPTRVPLGLGLMYGAGLLSGLLGIGSGPFKVVAMDAAMRLPMKVSSATSNFMIGVTAAASAWIYWRRGCVHPLIAGPTALGTMAGALVGSRLLPKLSNRAVRALFAPVLAAVAIRMIVAGVLGR
jgi:uncharacterized membrane protein YfcA